MPEEGDGTGARPGARILRIDVVAGLLLMALAAALWREAARLDAGILRKPGPGMLPQALAILLLACAAALTLAGWLRRDARAETIAVAPRGPLVVGLAIAFFAAGLRGASVAGVELPQLGLALVGPLTVIIAGHAGAATRARELVVVGLGLTAFCIFVFVDLLGMPIPVLPGAVEAALPRALAPEIPMRVAAAAEAALAAAIWRRAR
jgi:hypothetical protein